MLAIYTLRQLHEQLEGVTGELRRAVESMEPRRPAEFLYLRIKFAQVLSDYMSHAEQALYPRLASARNPRFAAAATQLRGGNEDLTDVVESYLHDWCLEAIERNWFEFRRATHAVINLVQRRMTREHLLLFSVSAPRMPEQQLARVA